MKGLVLYRILSFFVSILCALMLLPLAISALSLLVTLDAAEPFCLALALVLYFWYARKFFSVVYINNGSFTRQQRDWLQANAIVALGSALWSIGKSVIMLTSPKGMAKYADMFPPEVLEKGKFTEADLNHMLTFSIGLTIFFSLILVAHILWTYLLLRQHMQLQTTPKAEE